MNLILINIYDESFRILKNIRCTNKLYFFKTILLSTKLKKTQILTNIVTVFFYYPYEIRKVNNVGYKYYLLLCLLTINPIILAAKHKN